LVPRWSIFLDESGSRSALDRPIPGIDEAALAKQKAAAADAAVQLIAQALDASVAADNEFV
jgi:hypothetical protein